MSPYSGRFVDRRGEPPRRWANVGMRCGSLIPGTTGSPVGCSVSGCASRPAARFALPWPICRTSAPTTKACLTSSITCPAWPPWFLIGEAAQSSATNPIGPAPPRCSSHALFDLYSRAPVLLDWLLPSHGKWLIVLLRFMAPQSMDESLSCRGSACPAPARYLLRFLVGPRHA